MNYFGYLEGVNGVKTGFTNGAGRCLVTSTVRDNFNIITVVLGADTKKQRTSDSIKLIEYTYENYELIDIEQLVNEEFEKWKNINQKRIKIEKSALSKIEISLGELEYSKYPIKKGTENLVDIRINAEYKWEAPVYKNMLIGVVDVYIDNEKIQETELKFSKHIPRKNIKNYVYELLCFYNYV